MKTQILIVRDRESCASETLESIQAEQDMEVVAVVDHALKAVEYMWQRHPVHLILLDHVMPEQKGVSFIQSIRRIRPGMPVLVMSTFEDEDTIVRYLAHGANGYLVKNRNFSNLAQTIRDILKGQHVYPDNVAALLSQYLLRQLSGTPGSNQLPSEMADRFTVREKQIIDLLVQRISNQEIAETLFLSEGTVKNHLTQIFAKIPAKNRREAIRILSQSVEHPPLKRGGL
ncbi:response regulator [Cohnella sp. GCM10027633]|uniref:response regulator n=1 Tax=unclassified Cohnella TaxID=2636738 RepID=UPI003630A9BE